MPRNKDEENQTVHKHHSFYWNTSLTNKRMQEINEWIGTLTEEQRKMLSDIIHDAGEDATYSNNYDGV